MRKYDVYFYKNEEKAGEFLGIETTSDGVIIWILSPKGLILSLSREEGFLMEVKGGFDYSVKLDI